MSNASRVPGHRALPTEVPIDLGPRRLACRDIWTPTHSFINTIGIRPLMASRKSPRPAVGVVNILDKSN